MIYPVTMKFSTAISTRLHTNIVLEGRLGSQTSFFCPKQYHMPVRVTIGVKRKTVPDIQSDQKDFLHLIITTQNVTRIVRSVPTPCL
jgi:hypothetical protein